MEKRINIRASDYRFEDKVKYYKGFTNGRGQFKEGTKVQELLDVASQQDFSEKDIEIRYNHIIDDFLAYLESNGLIK